MMRRHSYGRSAKVIIALAFASLVMPAQEVRTYRPLRRLDVRSVAASYIPPDVAFEGIQTNGSEVQLAFLTETPGVPRQRGVLRIAASGLPGSVVQLPGQMLAEPVFDQLGSIHLMRTENGIAYLEKYTAGLLAFKQPVVSRPVALSVLNETPVVVTEDGNILVGRRGGTLLRPHNLGLRLDFPQLIVPIDDHTLAVVDRSKPLLRIVDLTIDRSNTVEIATPLVLDAYTKAQAVVLKGGPQSRPPLLFFGGAGDGRDCFFLAIGGGGRILRDGMIVGQFDRQGGYLRTLQLLPNTEARLVREGNPNGFVLQRYLSVQGTTAATLSSDGFVSFFTVSPH